MFKKIVLIAIGLVIVAGFATGVLNWSNLRTRAQHEEYRLKAKIKALNVEITPQEINMASACRHNLRRIESAKRAIASRTGVATGAVSWDAVLREMGGPRPVCPKGGEYRLGTLEQLPTCTIGANHTAPKEDDHAILRY